MTEKLHSPTQSSAPGRTVVSSSHSAPAISNHGSSKAAAPADEEPYTIKCICDFTDDDGNTIYCEACDTWQHIECYYPYNMVEVTREDFNHSCVECKPRPLDRDRANERQIFRQTNGTHLEFSDRKTTKRPPHKTQKKRARLSDLGLHGHSTSENMVKHTHDLPTHHQQHKKSKSSHRLSQSSGSQTAKRSPSCGQKATNPHGHPPSPATTPQDVPPEFDVHNFTSGFMDLYRDDREVAIVQTNSFASLTIPNFLSSWLRDHDKLMEESGWKFNDVFRPLPSNIDSIKAPTELLSKRVSMGPDTVCQWQFLASSKAVDKDIPLIELNGQIGFQKDYCEDASNRWSILTSPLPFVFFHPMLPIIIDTRKEGSQARYVRRSCRPNATIDTFLSDGSEYHFWLVSDRAIKAGEQITISWDIGLEKRVARRWSQLLGLSDETDKQPEFDESEMETYEQITTWVHNLLSEHGGCACDLGSECAFARFHQIYVARPQGKDRGSKQKKPRKPKTSNVSPTSTGQATNSRAPSEGRADDGADNDSRSSRSRSKPPSRDMTPAPRQGSFDMLGVLTELTDRDKRKVQMVEDSFRRMEQQQQPVRKKKRVAEGPSSAANTGAPVKTKSKSTSSNPTTTNSSNTTERRYVADAEAFDRVNDSPGSASDSPTSSHPLKQPEQHNSVVIAARRARQDAGTTEYREVAVQTDRVHEAWWDIYYSTAPPVKRQEGGQPRKRRLTLGEKLARNCRRRAEDAEALRLQTKVDSPSTAVSVLGRMELDAPAGDQANAMIIPAAEAGQLASKSTNTSEDVAMTDAVMESVDEVNASLPPPAAAAAAAAAASAAAASTLPTTASTSASTSSGVNVKTQELRVQLPPVPAFPSEPTGGSNVTPGSANSSSMARSPFSATNAPPPLGSVGPLPPTNSASSVQPSPVKKKLTLSDYTRSRQNKKSMKAPTTSIEEAKAPMTGTAQSEAAVKEKSKEV